MAEDKLREALKKDVGEILAFLDPATRKDAFKYLFGVMGVGLTVAVVVFLLPLIVGNLLAVGLEATLAKWRESIPILLAGAFLFPLVFFLHTAMEVISTLIAFLVARTSATRQSRIAGQICIIVVIAVGMMSYFTWKTYNAAQRTQPILATDESRNIEALTEITETHRKELRTLSERSNTLFASLNQTESDLKAAREALTRTLHAFDEQNEAAEQATKNLQNLKNRRDQISQRMQELERILEGQKPITQHDFERANRYNLILGIVLGFSTSLAASFVYRFLSGRRWRRLSASTSDPD